MYHFPFTLAGKRYVMMYVTTPIISSNKPYESIHSMISPKSSLKGISKTETEAHFRKTTTFL